MSGVTLGDKRLAAHIKTIADAIASADIRQTDREAVARTVGIALANGDPAIAAHVNAGVFVLLASDPLVPCAGGDEVGCPYQRVIRIPMHDSHAADGRSNAWRERAPYGQIRCVSCGGR